MGSKREQQYELSVCTNRGHVVGLTHATTSKDHPLFDCLTPVFSL